MRLRRAARALVALCSIPIAITIGGASPVHAEGGLDVSSVYTYTVDPAANVVRVIADMSFTNTVPNTTADGVVNRTYYDGFSIPLPVEAINAVAVQNGTQLTTRPEFIDGTESFFRLNVDFAGRLFYQQTAAVEVTYDIIGQQPRADLPTRVNAAYAAFNAYGIGDPGDLTVRVVVPAGYEIDTLGGQAVKSEEDGNTVYTASDIDQPQNFNLFVSARNDTALASANVRFDGNDFEVRGWPGDTDWNTFVERQINDGMPVLEDLVGVDWPVVGTTEVREAFTPYLYGYAGWFDPDSRELEIGEDLDPQTIVHELSHAWFNRRWFDERWISEGLAQEYAGLVNEQLGTPAVNPHAVDSAAAGALPLDQWANPDLGTEVDDTEDYAYNASWFVISGITDEIGVDRMRDVFAATDANTIAYLGDGPAEPSPASRDWRHFLDLVDEIGGSTTADGLIQTYVLAPDQVTTLAARADAQSRYDTLDSVGGDWAPPLAVRKEMAMWDFATASHLIDEATAVLDKRDELLQLLAPLEVAMVGTAESSYENATDDVTTAGALLDDQLDATRQVIAAVDAEADSRGFLDEVGLYGEDLAPLLDDAKAALASGDTDRARADAHEVTETIGRSHDLGRSRALRASVLIVLGVAAIAALTVFLVRRSRRRKSLAPAGDTL